MEPPRLKFCGDECYYEGNRRRQREYRKRRKAQGLSNRGTDGPKGRPRLYRSHTEKTTKGRRVSSALRKKVTERDQFCRLCGGEFNDWPIHVDHIIPAIFGGNDDPANLRATHSYCNANHSMNSIWSRYTRILKDRGEWPPKPVMRTGWPHV